MFLTLLIIYLSIHITLSASKFEPKIPKEYEIAPWHDFKPSVITYSFDDGTFNHLLKAVPLLDKYKFKGSFNLITKRNNDWDGYKKAAENGHEISSHTITHPHLKEMDKETQTQELKESKKLIEKMVGQECVTIVYPYCEAGDYEIMEKYYISGRSCSRKYISNNPDDMFDLSSFGIGNESNYKTAEDLNNLVDKAYEQKKWIIFLIHGIDNDGGYSHFDSFELENHFQYVTKNEKKFWVATFKDASKYILEANSLIISENKDDEDNIIIEVSTEYKTDITKLDFPVTVSRLLDEKWKEVTILKEDDLSEIESEIKEDKIIFDVVPGEKYILKYK